MSKKLLIALTLVVGILAGYYLSTTEKTGKAALVEGNENNTQCQYPTRPLVNGNCDNSDPANVPSEVAPTPSIVSEPTAKNQCK